MNNTELHYAMRDMYEKMLGLGENSDDITIEFNMGQISLDGLHRGYILYTPRNTTGVESRIEKKLTLMRNTLNSVKKMHKHFDDERKAMQADGAYPFNSTNC